MARRHLISNELLVDSFGYGEVMLRPAAQYASAVGFLDEAYVRGLAFNQAGITQRAGFSGPFSDFVPTDSSPPGDVWRRCWASGLQPSGLATIGGFVADDQADFCRLKILRNYEGGGGFNITVNHMDGAAPASSRVFCPGGVNYTWLPGTAILLVHEADTGFVYDGALSFNTGVWTLIPLG